MLITDIVQKTLDETVERTKRIHSDVEILAEVADISKIGAAERLVGMVVEKFGRLDYACNVAGILSFKKKRRNA
jgi:NAD(P)-dependent dehydrogenase (short-subunit alcohol dehydrogenase family)